MSNDKKPKLKGTIKITKDGQTVKEISAEGHNFQAYRGAKKRPETQPEILSDQPFSVYEEDDKGQIIKKVWEGDADKFEFIPDKSESASTAEGHVGTSLTGSPVQPE